MRWGYLPVNYEQQPQCSRRCPIYAPFVSPPPDLHTAGERFLVCLAEKDTWMPVHQGEELKRRIPPHQVITSNTFFCSSSKKTQILFGIQYWGPSSFQPSTDLVGSMSPLGLGIIFLLGYLEFLVSP